MWPQRTPVQRTFCVGYKQLTLTPDANAIIPSITTDAHAVQQTRYRFFPPFHASSKSRKQEDWTVKAGEQKWEGQEKKALFSNKNESHEKLKNDETAERNSKNSVKR